MSELHNLDLFGMMNFPPTQTTLENINWSKILLDVGASPCVSCPDMNLYACRSCNDQIKYSENFKYATAVDKRSASNDYVVFLEGIRKIGEGLKDLTDTLSRLVNEDEVPKDILVNHIMAVLPATDWSGVLAKVLLQRAGYLK